MEPLEIYNEYSSIGINSRPITRGLEFNMAHAFVDYKKESFRSSQGHNLAIFLETRINNAYPDIVFAEYDPRDYEKWDPHRNVLNSADLKILHYIYTKKNVTSNRIIHEMSLQYKQLLQSLEALMDANLIFRSDGLWKINNRDHIFGIKKIQAVEAKISKWEEVMQQAIINRSFASESYVLLNKSRKPTSNIVERIKSFGIGIYLYNNVEFRQITQAKRSRFPSNYSSIMLNEYIGRIINH